LTKVASAKRQRLAQEEDVQMQSQAKYVQSAEVERQRLQSCQKDGWNVWTAKAAEMNLKPAKSMPKPSDQLRAMTSCSQRDPDGVLNSLDYYADLVTTMSRKDLGTVKVALGTWHKWATQVMGYEPEHSFPPRSDSHMVKFTVLFTNNKTCQNYCGALLWMCHQQNAWEGWNTPRLRQAIKGVGNRQIQLGLVTQHAKVLLNQEQITLICLYLAQKNLFGLINLVHTAWEFLLRVQSEGLTIYKGCPHDVASLPSFRQNGMWSDSQGRLILRLAVRKNKQFGSTLIRSCRCAEVGPEACGVCHLARVAANFNIGEVIFSFTEKEVLSNLKKAMLLMGIPGHKNLGLKAFRAGRATQLLAQNHALSTILSMGEWKWAAVQSYVDVDTVDANKFVAVAQDHSDEEDEAPEGNVGDITGAEPTRTSSLSKLTKSTDWDKQPRLGDPFFEHQEATVGFDVSEL